MAKTRRKLFAEEDYFEQECKICGKHFSLRTSEYCSSKCANQDMEN